VTEQCDVPATDIAVVGMALRVPVANFGAISKVVSNPSVRSRMRLALGKMGMPQGQPSSFFNRRQHATIEAQQRLARAARMPAEAIRHPVESAAAVSSEMGMRNNTIEHYRFLVAVPVCARICCERPCGKCEKRKQSARPAMQARNLR
jgi:hypothetical protein